MNVPTKNIYLSEKASIPANRAAWQKKEPEQKKCHYKGRQYQIHQVLERSLKPCERLKSGLKALIAVVFTLTIALFCSAKVRAHCAKALSGREVEVYWKPAPKSKKENSAKPVTPPAPRSKKDNTAKPVTPPAPKSKKDNTAKPVTPPASKPTILNFKKDILADGLCLGELSPENRNVLTSLVTIWKTKDSSKEEWSTSELAALFKQNETATKELLESVVLKTITKDNYPTLGLNKLFSVLESSLASEHLRSSSSQPGVAALWAGRDINAAAFFGKGEDREIWTVKELAKFLAVDKDELTSFLKERIGPSEEGKYSQAKIGKVWTVPYGPINGLTRTQKRSVRWEMVVT